MCTSTTSCRAHARSGRHGKGGMTATANNSPCSGSGTRPAYTGYRRDVVDKFTHRQQTGVVAVLGCQVRAQETRAAPSQTVPVILSKEDPTMSLVTIRC